MQFGLPDPMQYRGDAQILRPRWAMTADATFVAELDGEVVGSITGMDWGSVFVLGPLTVHPDHWGQGIARLLIPPLLGQADTMGRKLTGLFTLPQSPKHIRLYESFGFATQFRTAIMEKPAALEAQADDWTLYSRLRSTDQEAALEQCCALGSALFDGLDLSREIRAVTAQRLGDTVLLRREGIVAGFAVCHIGAGTEAGSDSLYVKFATVRPGARQDFERLLDGCEGLAASVGVRRIRAGANAGRRLAYGIMRARGYCPALNGVAMHRPNRAGYDRADRLVIDDWR